MNYDEFEIVLKSAFPSVGPEALERFRMMESLYREWNARINVISRKDMDSLYDHHVLHSLAIAAYVSGLGEGYSMEEKHSVLDLGTGGGFPGIPLAILCPQWDFTLCDSVGKKTIVASEVAKALGLENVRVVNARAETLDRTFDFVVSRAVTTLETFYPWVKDKYQKAIFYLKGGDVNQEISDLLRRSHMKPDAIHTWKVSSFLDGDYFAEKFVIHIEKTYLCSPNCEKYKKIK